MDLAPGPCKDEPEVFFDPEVPEVIYSNEHHTEEYRLAMARWQREKRERELKAQLICLTMCPLPRRAACMDAGAGEEHGVWGGLLPEDRSALREGRPIRRASKPRSATGGTRVKMTRELLSGMSVSAVAEMHGTTRKTVLTQLTEQVMVLSTPSGNMQVA